MMFAVTTMFSVSLSAPFIVLVAPGKHEGTVNGVEGPGLVTSNGAFVTSNGALVSSNGALVSSNGARVTSNDALVTSNPTFRCQIRKIEVRWPPNHLNFT